MGREVAGGSAVPMPLMRRRGDDVAGQELLDRAAAGWARVAPCSGVVDVQAYRRSRGAEVGDRLLIAAGVTLSPNATAAILPLTVR